MRAKTANRGKAPHRVAMIAYDGLSMFEFAVACEVFGPEAGEWVGVPWYELVVCSDRPTRPVRQRDEPVGGVASHRRAPGGHDHPAAV